MIGAELIESVCTFSDAGTPQQRTSHYLDPFKASGAGYWFRHLCRDRSSASLFTSLGVETAQPSLALRDFPTRRRLTEAAAFQEATSLGAHSRRSKWTTRAPSSSP